MAMTSGTSKTTNSHYGFDFARNDPKINPSVQDSRLLRVFR